MPGRTENRDAARARGFLSSCRPPFCFALAAVLLIGLAGCSRRFYRNQADKEVEQVLAQKDKYPAWKIENWHVYPDKLARFADPTNPDRPPKPPDDPAAYDLSPNPQKPGHAGVRRVEGTGYLDLIAAWDRENRERMAREEDEERQKKAEPPAEGGEAGEEAEAGQEAPPKGDEPAAGAPAPKEYTAEGKEPSPLDTSGRRFYLLTLEQAAEIGLFNSREYQDRREDLYLVALPVTLERFAFAAQFFAAEEALRQYSGRKTPGGRRSNWTLNSGTGLSKLLPTGALLLLNFSNQTVFDFLSKKTVSASTLNFDAIQPLLRGGGRAVTMEPLTQAERNLLYQIRTYARFRKEFYVSIAGGSGGSISGGAFVPTGVVSNLTVSPTAGVGGSGLAPGVIRPVSTTGTGLEVTPGGSGRLTLAGAIPPSPSGYLSTMLQNIQIAIEQENIDNLREIRDRYQGLLEGDVVTQLQVDQVDQELLRGRSTLLLDEQQYLDALERFKLQIGLPTALNIQLDDAQLRPLIRQFRRSREISDQERATFVEASGLGALELVPRLRAELLRLFTTSAIVRGTAFARRIRERWAAWEKLSDKELTERLGQLRAERTRLLNLQADLAKKNEALSEADQARLAQVEAEIDLGTFEQSLRRYEAEYAGPGKPKKLTPAEEQFRLSRFSRVVSDWTKILVEARAERLRAVRESWPELPRVCVSGVDLLAGDLSHAEAVAAQTALLNRLDLMNVRAQTVDAWRQLAVFANALLGTFNVQYRLDSFSPIAGAQPLNIGGSGNRHELILDAQLPLVRKLERNNYRASLIAFQRQRRALQEAEDLVVQAVRGELRVLRRLAVDYKIQQRQLALAYSTLDSSLEFLVAPPRPGALGGGDGPAALTQQLLSAQRSLPQAQNALLSLWINYLNTRLQLYRDLELMPLDSRGVWIDEIRACDCTLDDGQPSRPGAPAGDDQRLPEPHPVPPAPGAGTG